LGAAKRGKCPYSIFMPKNTFLAAELKRLNKKYEYILKDYFCGVKT
jgi:hypothetical protein